MLRHYGFEVLGLEEIVSFTVPANMRSRRVMEKLGMTHDARDDFDHPSLPALHPMRRHVLYRMGKFRWARSLAENQKSSMRGDPVRAGPVGRTRRCRAAVNETNSRSHIP